MSRLLAALAFCFLGCSCSTVMHRPKTKPAVIKPDGKSTVSAAPEAPRKMQKWNPVWWLGNVDTPVPPEDYKPDDPHRERKWRWRNPGHNFTFYVIGIADREFMRVGLHPDDVFRPGGGLNVAMSLACPLPPLPFVSFESRHLSTYLGWRERGNFGAKLNVRWNGKDLNPKVKKKPLTAANDASPRQAKRKRS